MLLKNPYFIKSLFSRSSDCTHNLTHTVVTHSLQLAKGEDNFRCALVLKVSLCLLSNLCTEKTSIKIFPISEAVI